MQAYCSMSVLEQCYNALALLTASSGRILEEVGEGQPILLKEKEIPLDFAFVVFLLPKKWPRYC